MRISATDEEVALYLRAVLPPDTPWVLLYVGGAGPERRTVVLSNCAHPDLLIRDAAEAVDEDVETKDVRPV